MLKTSERLIEMNAVDTTERDIKNSDPVMFRCVNHPTCTNMGQAKWIQANRRFKNDGWSYQCHNCRAQKKTQVYTTVFLKSLNVINTTPRQIRHNELVDFKCHGCDATGQATWTNAQASFKRYGHTYQCLVCKNKKHVRKNGNG